MSTFAATIERWALDVQGGAEAVFKEAAQEMVTQMQALLTDTVYAAPESPDYRRTGFLRASLVASTTAMPALIRDNPGVAVPADLSDVMLVIEGADLGVTIFLGYTANYAAFVHFGAQGQAPRPWVDLVAQRWPEIVAAKQAEVKARFGF